MSAQFELGRHTEKDWAFRLQQEVEAWRTDRGKPSQTRHLYAGGARSIPVVVKRARAGNVVDWNLEAR